MCTNLALTQLNNKNPLALYSNIQDLYTNKLRLTTNPTDIILNKYTQPWTREAHSTAMTHLTTKILKTKNSKKKMMKPLPWYPGCGKRGFCRHCELRRQKEPWCRTNPSLQRDRLCIDYIRMKNQATEVDKANSNFD